MSNTTWNPSDKSASTTLSNANLTASTSASAGARAIGGWTTGKYYWEITYTTVNTNSLTTGVGLATGDLAFGSATGFCWLGRSTGGININAAASGSSLGAAVAQGSVVGVAVDFGAKLIWFRIAPAGNWNGSGTANPATGAGGVDISAISTGPLYAFMSGAASDVITANFGSSAFTGTVPSTFTSGLPISLYTTWNPSDLSGVTLSGSNLVATSTALQSGVRSVDRYLTGKYYWEVTATTWTTSNTGAGIAVSGAAFSALATNSTLGIGLFGSGSVIMNGTTMVSGFGTITSGALMCFAIDAGNRLFWTRLGAAGNWNNSAAANPATGVGGVSYAPLGVIAAYAWVAFGASGLVATANFGGSAFTGTAPSGFTAGLPSPNIPPLLAAETQVAIEEWISGSPNALVTQVAIEEWALTSTVVPSTRKASVWISA